MRESAPAAGTFVDLVTLRAEERPDAAAVTFLADGETQEETFTYGSLAMHARRIAARLQADGVAPGERALLLYPPGLHYIAAFLGCLHAGVIAVPAYPPILNRPSSQLATFIDNSSPSLALTVDGIAGLRDQLVEQEPPLGTVRWLATDTIEEGLEQEWRRPPIDSDTVAFLQYSSGSTATPKGVVLSHENLLVNTAAMCDRAHLGADTRTVSWLPPYHDAGLIGKVLTPITGGFPTVLMSPIAFLQRPARWVEAVDRYRATCSASPNFGFDLAIRKTTREQRESLDLSSWVCAMNTGEPIRAETLRRFAEAFGSAGFRYDSFYPCYGLAESTVMVGGPDPASPPRVTVLDRDELQAGTVAPAGEGVRIHELLACGYNLPGHRVEIVDPETHRALGEREIGEIWVNGPSVAQGYWNRPDESEEGFRARLADGDPTPFMRTGDLGFVDAGEIHVAGRAKDVIVVRGRNHYPQDIECSAEQAHDAVRPGCGAAFGVDEDGEERLVLVNEVDTQRLEDPEEALSAVSQAILRRHGIQPDAVVLIERGTLPKTSSGKQRRRATRERLLAGALPVVAERRAARTRSEPEPDTAGQASAGPRRSSRAIETWLANRLARETGIDRALIDFEMPFAELGLDSVRAVELVAELSAWLGREVADTAPWEHPTIARLARHLAGEEAQPVRREGARPAAVDEPVAVVGMACRFPGAPDLDAFRDLLRGGVDATGEIPPDRWDLAAANGHLASNRGGFVEGVDLFDPRFFGIAPAEAASIDPQQRLLLEVAWEALEHAGQAPDALGGSATGVFVGIGTADYFHLQAEAGALTPHSATGTAHSVAANRLSYVLDLQGPSVAVDTACSSSLVAIDLACRSLRDGESDMAIAGGVNLMLTPHLTIALTRAGMLAPDGRCKTFDAAADGYARGEGCGTVVLKRLSDAQRDGDRIHAIVRGSAVRQDGRTSGLSAPSGSAQQQVIRAALAEAGVRASEVGFVEAHGTGTELGDPIEVGAIAGALGAEGGETCRIGSVKANIGHLEAAAGVAGFIKAALALGLGELFPQPSFRELNPRIVLEGTRLAVSAEPATWTAPEGRPRFAGVSSFGFGGTIAHAVLEQPPEPDRRRNRRERPCHVTTLSARSESALRELASRTARHLDGHPDASLPDVAHTLNTGRARLPWRLAARTRSTGELSELLRGFGAGEPNQVTSGFVAGGRQPAVGFLFSGQGAQHPGMSNALYSASPTFRAALDECAAILDGRLDEPLLDVLFGPDARNLVNRTCYTQPALVAVEIALARLWASWGVVPDAVAGHSVGEIAAAHVAGALDLEDALTFAAERGRLMQELPDGGAMAAVMAPAETVEEAIAGHGDQVVIAAHNAPDSVTISGAGDAVRALVDRFEREGIQATLLTVSHAFHSPLIAPALEPLGRASGRCRPSAPSIGMVEGATGELVGAEPLDPAYWRRQAESPVLFARALASLDDELGAVRPDGPRVFVEVGPRPVLLGLARRSLEGTGREFIASLRPDGGAWAPLLDAAMRLHLLGVPIDWHGFDADYHRTVVALPSYPFERTRHWILEAQGAEKHPAPAVQPPAAVPVASAVPDPPARDELLAGGPAERRELLETYLQAALAAVLGVPSSTLDVGQPIADSGLDSIMVLDVRHRVERALSVPLPVVSIAEGATIAELADRLAQLLEGSGQAAPELAR